MVKVNPVKSKYKSQCDVLMADTNAIKEQVDIRVCSRCTDRFFLNAKRIAKLVISIEIILKCVCRF
jgi:hypothetical protein